MPTEHLVMVAGAVLVMAALYSTVGHGGGSGYLAVLALSGLAPEQLRPTALCLNVVVSSIATWRFASSGTFRRDLFVPLICASIPAAFLGGYVTMPPAVYRPILGAVLGIAAGKLLMPVRGREKTARPSAAPLIIAGALIGLLSGIVGIGGGIFLSPLVLLIGWASARQTAAISAPFILVNSLAALAGIVTEAGGLPVTPIFLAPLVVAVVIGGMVGAWFGSKRLGHRGLRTVLAIVLLVAGLKMFLPPGVTLGV